MISYRESRVLAMLVEGERTVSRSVTRGVGRREMEVVEISGMVGLGIGGFWLRVHGWRAAEDKVRRKKSEVTSKSAGSDEMRVSQIHNCTVIPWATHGDDLFGLSSSSGHALPPSDLMNGWLGKMSNMGATLLPLSLKHANPTQPGPKRVLERDQQYCDMNAWHQSFSLSIIRPSFTSRYESFSPAVMYTS